MFLYEFKVQEMKSPFFFNDAVIYKAEVKMWHKATCMKHQVRIELTTQQLVSKISLKTITLLQIAFFIDS